MKPDLLSSIAVKNANQLFGLRFGNKIDRLLGSGLAQRTMTYVYGKEDANRLVNTLCVNALTTYSSHVVFFDAGLSFDPYFMVRSVKDSESAEALLKSIHFSRAFTCHQLLEMVTIKLEKIIASDPSVNTVLISGIDAVFNEEDSTKEEIERIQLLIASTLKNIAKKNKNIVYVVASSSKFVKRVFDSSDTAIKLFQNEDGKEKALLSKHHARRFALVEL